MIDFDSTSGNGTGDEPDSPKAGPSEWLDYLDERVVNPLRAANSIAYLLALDMASTTGIPNKARAGHWRMAGRTIAEVLDRVCKNLYERPRTPPDTGHTQ